MTQDPSYVRALIDAAQASSSPPCSSCGLPNGLGDDCICGGEGTQEAEVRGLKRALAAQGAELRARVESAEKSLSIARHLRDAGDVIARKVLSDFIEVEHAQKRDLKLQLAAAITRNAMLVNEVMDEKAERVPVADFAMMVSDLLHDALEKVDHGRDAATELGRVVDRVEDLKGWTGTEACAPSHYMSRSDHLEETDLLTRAMFAGIAVIQARIDELDGLIDRTDPNVVYIGPLKQRADLLRGLRADVERAQNAVLNDEEIDQ